MHRITLPSGDREVCVGVSWGGRCQAPVPWPACGSPARPFAGWSSGMGQGRVQRGRASVPGLSRSRRGKGPLRDKQRE